MINLISDICKEVIVACVLIGSSLLMVKGVFKLFCSFIPKSFRPHIKNFVFNNSKKLYNYYLANKNKSKTITFNKNKRKIM